MMRGKEEGELRADGEIPSLDARKMEKQLSKDGGRKRQGSSGRKGMSLGLVTFKWKPWIKVLFVITNKQRQGIWGRVEVTDTDSQRWKSVPWHSPSGECDRSGPGGTFKWKRRGIEHKNGLKTNIAHRQREKAWRPHAMKSKEKVAPGKKKGRCQWN